MSKPVNADLEELARFREEWKREVQQKRKAGEPKAPPERPRTRTVQLGELDFEIPEDTSSGTATPQPGPSSETISGSPSAFAPPSQHFNNAAIPAGVRHALVIYKRAVEHEQSGQLDAALALYRQAFRMEPNVDRAYHTQEMLASISAAQTPGVSSKKPGEDVAGVDELGKALQLAVTIGSGEAHGGIVTGTLASLVEAFPLDLVFEPEDEEQPLRLNILPEELLVLIIRKLDHTSIERFAAVSRKARVLTLDPSVWRSVAGFRCRVTSYANHRCQRIRGVVLQASPGAESGEHGFHRHSISFRFSTCLH
jgi:F-box protein 9